MDVHRVLISDACDSRCADILLQAGCEVTIRTDLTKEQLIDVIKEFDGLVVRSATKVTADVINAAPKLKVIGRAGTGVDNIDCEAATKNGVLVINAPGGNTMSAAEMTCALIVSLARDVAAACASLKGGRWDRKNFMGNEMFGKTIGIVGLGRIGREVAIRMQSFGMKTIGYDPIIPAEVAATFNVQAMTLEELWPLCDYITVHTPLIPQTKNLINAAVLRRCKKGVKIINCARGGIVNEDDLLAALESGQASGAGFDVFEEEPPKNTAFLAHPKVICTPHLGANTKEAQIRVAIEIAEQFSALRKGESIAGAVNAPLLAPSLAPENRQIVRLARGLGGLAVALAPNSESFDLVVETCGSKLAPLGKFIAAAVAVGALRGLEEDANFINLPGLAEKRRITYSSQEGAKIKCHHFTECIRVTVKGSATHVITGSPGDVNILLSIDDAKFCAGAVLIGSKIVATGPSDSLGQVAQAILPMGNMHAIVSSACGTDTYYVIASEVCTKTNPAPAPLTHWATVHF